MAERHACLLRVIKRGDTWLFYTFELRPDRANVGLRAGRVAEVYGTF